VLIAGVVAVLCCGGGDIWVSLSGVPFVEPDAKGPGLYIRNDRPERIKVRIVFRNSAIVTEQIAPGAIRGYPTAVSCDATLIEATQESGYILGRLDSGGCVEQTWVIGADGTTQFLPGHAEH